MCAPDFVEAPENEVYDAVIEKETRYPDPNNLFGAVDWQVQIRVLEAQLLIASLIPQVRYALRGPIAEFNSAVQQYRRFQITGDQLISQSDDVMSTIHMHRN